MLQKNHLCPPRPRTVPDRRGGGDLRPSAFVGAADFDGTGILAGVDPCESRYWWMPELSTNERAPVPGHQAARVRHSAADA